MAKSKVTTSPAPMNTPAEAGGGPVNWIKDHKYAAAVGAAGLVIVGYLLYQHFHNSSSTTATTTATTSAGGGSNLGGGYGNGYGNYGAGSGGGLSGGSSGGGNGSGLAALESLITGNNTALQQLQASEAANSQAQTSALSGIQSSLSQALSGLSAAVTNLASAKSQPINVTVNPNTGTAQSPSPGQTQAATPPLPGTVVAPASGGSTSGPYPQIAIVPTNTQQPTTVLSTSASTAPGGFGSPIVGGAGLGQGSARLLGPGQAEGVAPNSLAPAQAAPSPSQLALGGNPKPNTSATTQKAGTTTIAGRGG